MLEVNQQNGWRLQDAPKKHAERLPLSTTGIKKQPRGVERCAFWSQMCSHVHQLGGGFTYFCWCSRLPGKMFQFDEYFCPMGWNHELVNIKQSVLHDIIVKAWNMKMCFNEKGKSWHVFYQNPKVLDCLRLVQICSKFPVVRTENFVQLEFRSRKRFPNTHMFGPFTYMGVSLNGTPKTPQNHHF